MVTWSHHKNSHNNQSLFLSSNCFSASKSRQPFAVMNLQMVFSMQPTSRTPVISVPSLQHAHLKLRPSPVLLSSSYLPHRGSKTLPIRCASTSPWEPAPTTYRDDNTETKLVKQTSNIFETMTDEETESSVTNNEHLDNTISPPIHYLKWPLYLLGPTILLITGVVPTLWLPISSVFIGPNIATVLALTGLDCIFNLGASLFLLMADSTARTKSTENFASKPPSSYQFWNMFANVIGFLVPLITFFCARHGFFQNQIPFISFLVLLGPYFLLLCVQLLTEMLTWHWESPVWLLTPVVYESYRLLQLMRGLKLGSELAAPVWMLNTIRGLVCGWVLVLGVQLMRVAWYAGFTARAYRQHSAASDTDA